MPRPMPKNAWYHDQGKRSEISSSAQGCKTSGAAHIMPGRWQIQNFYLLAMCTVNLASPWQSILEMRYIG